MSAMQPPPGPPPGGPAPGSPQPGGPPPGMGAPQTQPQGQGKGKGGKPPRGAATDSGRRNARLYTILAVVAAMVTGLILLVGGEEEVDETLVMRHTAPVSALEEVRGDELEAVAIPTQLAPEGAVTADSQEHAAEIAEELDGRVARQDIPEGASVYDQRFTDELADAAGLEPHERLLTVEAAADRSVAGRVQTGDRVDILAVGEMTLPAADTEVTELQFGGRVARDMEVVAAEVSPDVLASAEAEIAGGGAGEEDTGPSSLSRGDVLPPRPIPGMYTLRVDAQQAVDLALIADNSELVVTYRPPDATDPDPVYPRQPGDVVCSMPEVDLLDEDGNPVDVVEEGTLEDFNVACLPMLISDRGEIIDTLHDRLGGDGDLDVGDDPDGGVDPVPEDPGDLEG